MAEAGQLVQLDDLFTGIWLVDEEEQGGDAIGAEMAADVGQAARLSAMRQSVLGSLPELPAQSDIPGSPGGPHSVWIVHAPIDRSGHVPMSGHAATPRLCCDLVRLGSMCVIVGVLCRRTMDQACRTLSQAMMQQQGWRRCSSQRRGSPSNQPAPRSPVLAAMICTGRCAGASLT